MPHGLHNREPQEYCSSICIHVICPFAVYEYAKQNCRKRIQTDAQSGEKFRNIHIMVKGVCSRKEDNPN